MKRRLTSKSKARRTPAARKASSKTPRRVATNRRVILMVGTRKGAFIYHGDATRSRWRLDGPHRLGEIVNHVVLDPRDGKTMLMAARADILDLLYFARPIWARTWKEAAEPPAFPKAAAGENGRAVEYTFWLSPAHRSEHDAWYAGLRRRRCSEAKMVESRGAASMATTSILCIQNGIRRETGTPDGRYSVR